MVRWDQTVACGDPADVLLTLLQNRGKGGAVSKLMESMAAEEDFEPNQDSSFSEDENIPLSMLVERPSTPGEGRILQVEELGRFPGAAQRTTVLLSHILIQSHESLGWRYHVFSQFNKN